MNFSLELIAQLLAVKATNVNHADKNGMTGLFVPLRRHLTDLGLHWAITLNLQNLALELCSAKADSSIANSEGVLPIHSAAASGMSVLLEIFLDEVRYRCWANFSPLVRGQMSIFEIARVERR